jgi:DNA processing protein
VSHPLSEAERRDWLRLARSENVGPVTFRELVRRYGSAGEALAALPELARRGGRVGGVRVPSAAEVAAELERGDALGARPLCACEPDFPRHGGVLISDPTHAGNTIDLLGISIASLQPNDFIFA